MHEVSLSEWWLPTYQNINVQWCRRKFRRGPLLLPVVGFTFKAAPGRAPNCLSWKVNRRCVKVCNQSQMLNKIWGVTYRISHNQEILFIPGPMMHVFVIFYLVPHYFLVLIRLTNWFFIIITFFIRLGIDSAKSKHNIFSGIAISHYV